MTGAQARAAIRAGEHRLPTWGLAPDYAQANLVVVPHNWADDLRALCARNPVPCPLIEELERGEVEPKCARGADLRTDLGAYRIWRDGALVEQCDDVLSLWSGGLCAFLIGCSFTFERALNRAGLTPRHQRLGTNVPMYRTTVPLAASGKLRGSMVVSMRPYHSSEIERVRAVTRPYGHAHGEPVYWGDPAGLGIRDVRQPEFGDPSHLEADDVPVFWGCGVTPQAVIMQSGVPFAITHQPGHMFITDQPCS